MRIGIGAFALTAVLIAAKATGASLSWILVFAPIWAPLALFLIFAAGCLALAALAMGQRRRPAMKAADEPAPRPIFGAAERPRQPTAQAVALLGGVHLVAALDALGAMTSFI